MGLTEGFGIPEGFFGNFSGQGAMVWVGIILLCFVILVFVGGITLFVTTKKSKKLSFKNKVPIFKEVSGKLKRIGIDDAKELFIPDSNISLFYLKNHGIYLARPTRSMGENEYWYVISENGEWVNFDLTKSAEKNTLAEANYDHRDTRYAYVNLKEIIKKNYKDKSVVWWKDPVVMNIITFVIMSLIFIGFCWFVIAKLGGVISEISSLIDKLAPLVEHTSKAQNINSGVSQA